MGLNASSSLSIPFYVTTPQFLKAKGHSPLRLLLLLSFSSIFFLTLRLPPFPISFNALLLHGQSYVPSVQRHFLALRIHPGSSCCLRKEKYLALCISASTKKTGKGGWTALDQTEGKGLGLHTCSCELNLILQIECFLAD